MKIDMDMVLKIAAKTAQKSPCKYKVSCILVDNRGRIVATGFNHRTTGNKMGRYTLHAEADALNQVRKPSNNLIAFIYRKNSRNINPCPACSRLLYAYGIQKVFCTHEDAWKNLNNLSPNNIMIKI